MNVPSDDDLEALLKQFQTSDIRELHVRTGDFELFLSKGPAAPAPWSGGGEATFQSYLASPSRGLETHSAG